MSGRTLDLFERIRAEATDRLVDGRAALQLGLAAQTPEMARVQLDAVLERFAGVLTAPDVTRYRAVTSRWVAYHLGEGFSPENLIHSIVTTGDILVQVARRRLPPEPDTAVLVRDLTRATHALARLVVDVLGGELGKLAATGGR